MTGYFLNSGRLFKFKMCGDPHNLGSGLLSFKKVNITRVRGKVQWVMLQLDSLCLAVPGFIRSTCHPIWFHKPEISPVHHWCGQLLKTKQNRKKGYNNASHWVLGTVLKQTFKVRKSCIYPLKLRSCSSFASIGTLSGLCNRVLVKNPRSAVVK